jgi:hypothetical protein
MKKISGLKINEAEYELPDKRKGKIAVLMYQGNGDPKKILDHAVRIYVQNDGYHELIDANLDNPWMRVIISDINNMKQVDFDETKHRLVQKNKS